MFVGRFLRDGSTLYVSRSTGLRYILAPSIFGARPYVNGTAMSQPVPRKEAIRMIAMTDKEFQHSHARGSR